MKRRVVITGMGTVNPIGNSVKEAWVPYFKLDIEYTGDEVSLSYARWNSKDNAYNDNIT